VDNLSKSVVLAEKPSVARDIARVLGCQKKEMVLVAHFNCFIENCWYVSIPQNQLLGNREVKT